MQILLSQLNAQQTTDLVGTIVGQESTKAVLVIDRAFLNDRSMADLVDGQYTILGKIVRTIPKESDASINLLRNTPLGKLSGSVIAQLANGLAAATEAGLNFPKFELELSGPVIQVIPIAIFI